MSTRRLALLGAAYLVAAAALVDPDRALSWTLRTVSIGAGRIAGAMRSLSISAGAAYLDVAYPPETAPDAPAPG